MKKLLKANLILLSLLLVSCGSNSITSPSSTSISSSVSSTNTVTSSTSISSFTPTVSSSSSSHTSSSSSSSSSVEHRALTETEWDNLFTSFTTLNYSLTEEQINDSEKSSYTFTCYNDFISLYIKNSMFSGYIYYFVKSNDTYYLLYNNDDNIWKKGEFNKAGYDDYRNSNLLYVGKYNLFTYDKETNSYSADEIEMPYIEGIGYVRKMKNVVMYFNDENKVSSITYTLTYEDNSIPSTLTFNYDVDEIVLPPVHEHNYSKEWSYDDNCHWHACDGCDENENYAEHEFKETETGFVCEICGYVKPKELKNITEEDLIFELNNDNKSYAVTGINIDDVRKVYTVDIPNTHNNLPVTVLDDSLFSNYTNLINAKLPEGLSEISFRLFYKCTNLKSVEIPSSVTKIGNGAFYKCESLECVDIPANVTEIEDSAFYGCTRLAEINLSASLLRIGNRSFYKCTRLNSIILPHSLTYADSQAFGYCENLNAIYYEGSLEEWSSVFTYEEFPNNISESIICYYSETNPTDKLHTYWSYVDGKPVVYMP